jgi:oligopeptide/dipeptide ABC transporter ATP-binding protein
MAALLEVRDSRTHFCTFDGIVKASDGVSFHIDEGEVLALVGESGSGKSVTARSIMGLYSGSKVRQSGSILFRGEDLCRASPQRRRELRGRDIGMIFQEPMSAFDPLASISEQMVEARLTHFKESRDEARALAIESLRQVGIPEPEKRIDDYPHRLSGGMLQRVLISMAIMNKPRLLIADEPTTALDVTIQAQVLRLLNGLRKEMGAALLFITHDLGVVAEIADRVHVMYAGKIVEKAGVRALFSSALHPYSKGLLDARVSGERKGKPLPAIPGSVPRPSEIAEDCCRFAPRCAHAGPRCLREEPPLAAPPAAGGVTYDESRELACWLYNGGTE